MLILTLLLLTGCSVGPAYIPPAIEIPAEWKNRGEECEDCGESEDESPNKEVDLAVWWQVFEDPKLEELESLALENNRDLFVAYERIQAAQALMGIAASELYPQINLAPTYTNTGELIKAYGAIPGFTNIFRAHELLYYFPVNLSYEVDLWGKIRDQYDAAKYQWLAQRKDYQVVMLSLTTNLAIAYYQLRALDAQIELLLKVIETRQKAYEINLARYEEQITFYADVTLAGEEVDIAIGQYQESLRQRDLLEDQIAVLIGVPASEFCLESMPIEGLPPCIPSGIPSEVLLRRPDIAEAELLVRSNHASVKEAYAQFFPSLTLTSTGGFESPIFKDFMKWIGRFWMFGAQSNQLIFDGFATPYNLTEQIALFKEAGGEYQQQVLVAFQEVEDALTSINSYAKQYDLAVETSIWAEKTHQLYLDRYTLGVIYYIDVANTERDMLNYEISVSVLQGYRFVSTIQLIKALGGGW